jgi:hypothetical protein
MEEQEWEKLFQNEGIQQEGRAFLEKQPEEIRLVGKLQEFALETFGEDAFPTAWDEFSLWKNRPMDPLEEPDLSSIFMAWFVFHWVPKSPPFPNIPIAKFYLEKRKAHLSPSIRTFIQLALQTPYRFFQILSYDPKKNLSLYDLFLDREVLIPKPKFFVPLKAGEIFFSLLLPIQGQSTLLSSAPTRLTPRSLDLLLFHRDDMKRRFGTLDEACLLQRSIELRTLYHEERDKLLEVARLPKNSDGDDFVPLRAYYSLEGSVQETLRSLLPLSLEKNVASLLRKAGLGSNSVYTEIRFPILQKGNPKHLDWPTTTIGWIELEPGFLRFFTNSEERAEALHGEITQLLGKRALYSSLEDLDPDSYREHLVDHPGPQASTHWAR